jgi:hypothetical protein
MTKKFYDVSSVPNDLLLTEVDEKDGAGTDLPSGILEPCQRSSRYQVVILLL